MAQFIGNYLVGSGRMEKVLDILLRMVLGTLTILLVNILLENLGIPTVVGVNGKTVLTCTILGFPGVVALYVFGFYKLL